MVRIHSPRPILSNTYSHSQIVIRVQAGSILVPILTRMSHSVTRCARVLMHLPSGDFDDPLGAYQEL